MAHGIDVTISNDYDYSDIENDYTYHKQRTYKSTTTQLS